MNDYVVLELAVERVEIVVSRCGAVVLQVAPVEVVVVDEGAVKNDSAVRLEGAGDYVGSVRVSASVGGGTGAAFGVRFDYYSGEIGDLAVDFVEFFAPPGGYLGVQRVEGG